MAYVGVGRRAVAVIIDAIIIGIVIGGIGGVLGGAMMSGSSDPTAAAGSLGMIQGILGLLGFLYLVVMEALTGQTIGKMVMGIRVVKVDGTPISWKESIIRNILRIIDGLLAYIVGAIFVWTSPMKQRLGDKAAGTIVVRTGADVAMA